MLPKSGDILADKYLLSDTLGAGGFGVVFKATDQLLGRTVAIKIMRVTGGSQEDGLKRFFGEARNTSQLSHPHNVRVFDFGHAGDEMVYLVMEYVEGKQLSGMDLPMQGPRLVKLLLQICRALGEAHALGLVHRDLKPDNVLVSQVDGADFARVLDYGIAKLEGSTGGLTGTGGFIGTPQYAAPEQLTGKPIDRRADIYALGAMSWTLLVGRPLFVAEDPIGIAYMHVHQAPERPSEHVAVSKALEDVLMRCLEKSADKRFESMEAVYSALCATPEAGAEAAPVGTMPAQPSLATQMPPARGAGPLVGSQPTLAESRTDAVAVSDSVDETGFDSALAVSRGRRRLFWGGAIVLAVVVGGTFAMSSAQRGDEHAEADGIVGDDATPAGSASDTPNAAASVGAEGEPNTQQPTNSVEDLGEPVTATAADALPADGSGAEPPSADALMQQEPQPVGAATTVGDAAQPGARTSTARPAPAERSPSPSAARRVGEQAPAPEPPREPPSPSAEPEERPTTEAAEPPAARDRRAVLENMLGTPEPEPDAEPEPPSRRDLLDNTLNRAP